jgi:hypothetical protein
MMIPTSGPSGSGSASWWGAVCVSVSNWVMRLLAPRPAARCRGAAGGLRIGSGRRQHRPRRGRRPGQGPTPSR